LTYGGKVAREFATISQPFRVSIEGQSREVSLVIVGRTKHYGGPFKITTKADLFEDQFEFVGLTTQSGLKYLSYLPTLWFGDLRKEEGVYFWKSDRLCASQPTRLRFTRKSMAKPLAPLARRIPDRPARLRLLVPGPRNCPAEQNNFSWTRSLTDWRHWPSSAVFSLAPPGAPFSQFCSQASSRM